MSAKLKKYFQSPKCIWEVEDKHFVEESLSKVQKCACSLSPLYENPWKSLFPFFLEDKCRKTDGPQLSTLHTETHTYLSTVLYSNVVANFQNESCGKSFMTSAAVICNIYYDLIMEFQDMLKFRFSKRATQIWWDLSII